MEDRRTPDPMMVEIKTRLIDHIDRYERDWKHTQSWRGEMNTRLKVHCDFINDVSPIYKTLCKILSLVAVASVGLAVAAFWRHFTWH